MNLKMKKEMDILKDYNGKIDKKKLKLRNKILKKLF